MTTLMPADTYLNRALADGRAEITGEGRSERIRYAAAGHSKRWSDPEEKLRAELLAELIYKYEYPPERIRFEVNVPRRTPNDFADLVIYNDDELKALYFVFEYKRADVSDTEFNQSIEQACGNRASLGAHYCGAAAGLTRRLLRFDKFPAGERDRNHLTDIPVRYGTPPRMALLQEPARERPGRRPPGGAAGRHPQVPSDPVGGRTAQSHRRLWRVLQNRLHQTPRRKGPGAGGRQTLPVPAPRR